MTIGGVRRDITKDMIPRIQKDCKYFKEAFKKLKRAFLDEKTVQMRSQKAGVLTYKEAIQLCAVGPTARASGVKKEVRYDTSYFAYGDLDTECITPAKLTGEVNGDVYDRIIQRLLEVKQAIELIEECLDKMPSGDIVYEPKVAKVLAQLKKVNAEGVGRHEAPRGEVIHYVKMDGNDAPFTWKVRAPTYNNILPWIPMLKGEQIADIPIVAASTDPCMSCTNRVAIVNNGQRSVLNKEQLHDLSIQKTRRMMK